MPYVNGIPTWSGVMQYVKRFAANESGRDFVVGDLHGEFALFQKALDLAKFDLEKDRIFSVGDLIDRGPKSLDCVNLLNEPWFNAVRGNHEDMFLDAMNGENLGLWVMNGGGWAEHVDPAALEGAAKLIKKKMSLVMVVGEGENRFNVLHAETDLTDAEIDAGTRFDNYAVVQQILWGRTRISYHKKSEALFPVNPTYVGHTIVPTPLSIGNHVYIDTGSFRTFGSVTLVDTKSHEIYRATK